MSTLHSPSRDPWHEAPSNFRPPLPDPLRDTDVRAEHRRGDSARAFNVGLHGSSAMLDAPAGAELDALHRTGPRAGYG